MFQSSLLCQLFFFFYGVNLVAPVLHLQLMGMRWEMQEVVPYTASDCDSNVKRSVNVAIMLRRVESLGTQLHHDNLGPVQQREMALRQKAVERKTFGVLTARHLG